MLAQQQRQSNRNSTTTTNHTQLPPFRDMHTAPHTASTPLSYLDRPNFSQPLSHRGHQGAQYEGATDPTMASSSLMHKAMHNPKLYPDNTVPNHQAQTTPIRSMSGEVLSASDFTHNNMVPFFGGNVQQNVSPHAAASTLELHTGVSTVLQHKETRSPFFSPAKGNTHIHGSPALPEELIEGRYELSKYKQGEKPKQEVRVGPGLNQGYSSNPTGGFQQQNMREYVMPKSVDELRTKTNPKVTYTNPMIRGRALNIKRGEHGTVSKNRPDNFYVNSPARYNTTTGIVKGRRLRTVPIDRSTHRHETMRSHTGGAAQYNHETKRPDEYVRTANPFREEIAYGDAGLRNANNQDTWGDFEAFTGTYGKKGIEVLPNERDTTQLTNYLSNAASFVKAMIAPLADVMKTTRKENVIGNPRATGNMNSAVKKLPVKDPNDVARTTLKETNIHDTRTGNMSGASRLASTVYDPNDVARTTIKETNIHDNRTGNLKGPTRLATYDPNDVARTTIKETNIHDNRTGNINDLSRHGGPVYDPNDVARTTIKETNIHDNRTGNINDLSRHGGPVYDPNDIARTTIKETNIHDNRTGNINDGSRYTVPVYDPNDIAKTTIKETNIHDNRTGNVGMRITRLPAYDPNDITKTTIKETNIHDTRTGHMSAVPSGEGGGSKAQGVVHPMDDAKVTVRETTDPESTSVNLRGRNKSIVYDPTDIARVTIKETNIDNTRQGNVTGIDTKGGYTTNPKEAPHTNRQFTADVEYSGVADGEEVGGYNVANVEAPATQRHELSDKEYAGTADSNHKAPMSYEDIYNATLDEVKETIAEGRQPTLTSAKTFADKSFVQMEQKDDHDRQNHRDTISTRVGQQLHADVSRSSVTKDKVNLDVEPERNQPDESLVRAFEENPYTKSLNSSA